MPRSRTVPIRVLERDYHRRRRRGERLRIIEHPRPQTRADCIDGPRPCPYVGCKYHLYLDVKTCGSIVLNHDDIDDMDETCVLDVAEREPTQAEVGRLIGTTGERVRQLETDAIAKLMVFAQKMR